MFFVICCVILNLSHVSRQYRMHYKIALISVWCRCHKHLYAVLALTDVWIQAICYQCMLFQNSVIIRVRYSLCTLCIVDDSLLYWNRPQDIC